MHESQESTGLSNEFLSNIVDATSLSHYWASVRGNATRMSRLLIWILNSNYI